MRRADWIRNEYTVCKRLCFLLRHAPSVRDLPIRRDGYVCALHLLAQPELKGIKWSQLLFIIRTNYKQRFGTAIQSKHLRTRTYRKQTAELSVVSNASDVDELTESDHDMTANIDTLSADTIGVNPALGMDVYRPTPLRTLYPNVVQAQLSHHALDQPNTNQLCRAGLEVVGDELQPADNEADGRPNAAALLANAARKPGNTADKEAQTPIINAQSSTQPFPSGLCKNVESPSERCSDNQAGIRRPVSSKEPLRTLTRGIVASANKGGISFVGTVEQDALDGRNLRPFQRRRRESTTDIIYSLPPRQDSGCDAAVAILYPAPVNEIDPFPLPRLSLPDDPSFLEDQRFLKDRCFPKDRLCCPVRCDAITEDTSRSPAYRRMHSIKHLEGRFECDDGNDSSSADESNEGAKASQLSVGDFTLREVSVWDTRLDAPKDLSRIWVRAFQGHSVKEVDAELLCETITRANIDRFIPLRVECNDCADCDEEKTDENMDTNRRRHLVPTCVHGTTYANLKLIRQFGLSRMRRSHIHFAKGLPDELMRLRELKASSTPEWGGGLELATESVHIRQNSEVGIYIDLLKCIDNSIPFYLTKNHILISPGNPQGLIPPQHILRVIDLKTRKPVVDSE